MWMNGRVPEKQPGQWPLRRARGTSRTSVEDGGMSREFTVIIERDEDGYYIASVPELRGCHTQARSLDELTERVKEAILLCLDVQQAEEELT